MNNIVKILLTKKHLLTTSLYLQNNLKKNKL